MQRILKLFTVFVLIICISTEASLSSRVRKKLTGGDVTTKSLSLWELHKFKDTQLLTLDPLCWTPWRSYITVSRYVTIGTKNNRNCISIGADIVKMLSADAKYNKRFAKRFKVSGTIKKKVRQIYTYCRKIKYTTGIKTAREAFTTGKGDCAAIASAFYVLCRSKKIPVRFIIGWEGDECHAWNRVKISGRWYWIDATFHYWLSPKQYYGRKVMEVW